MSRSPRGAEAVASGVPEYASTRLIAYIGNKRALLPFLMGVFMEEAERAAEPSSPSRGPRFLDPFAGSGAVSRLARGLGWTVSANDAEEYSRAVNEAWLGVSADELPALFEAEGGPEAVFAALSELHPSSSRGEGEGGGTHPLLAGFAEPEPYIARHYAPADTSRADWRTERLFYTRENAVFLDRARCAIDFLRPAAAESSRPAAGSERALLLGALIYQAATHANTSGVFKAYHKGFGGHGRDALGRILAPMRMEPPLLWPGPPSEVRRGDAAEFCASRPADICYLDPPYNQHQYGSNYHLLNTLANWDRPPVSEERGPDGRFLSVSGIPGGWVESRSPYCSRSAAPRAFRDLAAAVDARVVMLSYNSDGIVAPEELYEILSDRAEVSLRSVDYVAYRGGRQSASRRSATSEILFIARRIRAAPRASSPRADMGDRLAALRARMDLDRVLAAPLDPEAFARLAGGDELRFEARDRGTVTLKSYRGLVLESSARIACSDLVAEDAAALAKLLGDAALDDYAEACGAVAAIIEAGAHDRRVQDLALAWLRKLAHRRYEDSFRVMSVRLGRAAAARPEDLGRLSMGVRRIDEQFSRRMEGRSGRASPYQETTRTDEDRSAPSGSLRSHSARTALGPSESLARKHASAEGADS